MKKNKGITLIALIITIIVLIILAGISIAILTGEDGLITKAKQGAQNYQNATIEEQERLNDISANFDMSIVTEATPSFINQTRATATADKVLKNYTAYVNGQLVIGSMNEYKNFNNVDGAQNNLEGDSLTSAYTEAGIQINNDNSITIQEGYHPEQKIKNRKELVSSEFVQRSTSGSSNKTIDLTNKKGETYILSTLWYTSGSASNLTNYAKASATGANITEMGYQSHGSLTSATAIYRSYLINVTEDNAIITIGASTDDYTLCKISQNINATQLVGAYSGKGNTSTSVSGNYDYYLIGTYYYSSSASNQSGYGYIKSDLSYARELLYGWHGSSETSSNAFYRVILMENPNKGGSTNISFLYGVDGYFICGVNTI